VDARKRKKKQGIPLLWFFVEIITDEKEKPGFKQRKGKVPIVGRVLEQTESRGVLLKLK